MKLATLRNGRPDGHLVVVASDLSRCVSAGRIAPTLQAALDGWEQAHPALVELSAALNGGNIGSEPFDVASAMAPLPRAYQRIETEAFPAYHERLRRGTAGEESAGAAALYYGVSGVLGGPSEPIVLPQSEASADFSAELVAILGPVARGANQPACGAAIRLLSLANDVTFRRHDDLFHARASAAFAPVAVTPDELGSGWRGEKAALRVRVLLNGALFGQPDAGAMQPDFAALVMAAAQARPLGAGTLLGSGTVSNRHEETPPIRREGIGFASIAEARAAEKVKYGRTRTPFLKPGDRVRIVAVDAEERPVFGTIDQTVTAAARA